MENDIKSAEVIKTLEFLFSKLQQVLYKCSFFVLFKSYSISCLGKKSGKSLKFWIQRSVRTLIVVRVSMLGARERGVPGVDLMD